MMGSLVIATGLAEHPILADSWAARRSASLCYVLLKITIYHKLSETALKPKNSNIYSNVGLLNAYFLKQ